MTDNNHPITPPRELVAKWITEGRRQGYFGRGLAELVQGRSYYVATQSARWGYEQRGAVNEAKLQKARDEEREACVEWLETGPYGFSIEATAPSLTKQLRAARRPEPKSQAEEALETITEMANCMAAGFIPKRSDLETIRTALERLRELEGGDDRTTGANQ